MLESFGIDFVSFGLCQRLATRARTQQRKAELGQVSQIHAVGHPCLASSV